MKKTLTLSTILAGMAIAPGVLAQDAFLGEVRAFAGSFCPYGWYDTDGSMLSPGWEPALFSLIGCEYGGDCRTTFALPNIEGRTLVGWQSPAGGSPFTPWNMGDHRGLEVHTTPLEHTHPLKASSSLVASPNPEGHSIPSHASGSGVEPFQTSGSVTSYMADGAIEETGVTDVDNRQPGLVIKYCIAYMGDYPPRN